MAQEVHFDDFALEALGNHRTCRVAPSNSNARNGRLQSNAAFCRCRTMSYNQVTSLADNLDRSGERNG
jgi:hypothetical protein